MFRYAVLLLNWFLSIWLLGMLRNQFRKQHCITKPANYRGQVRINISLMLSQSLYFHVWFWKNMDKLGNDSISIHLNINHNYTYFNLSVLRSRNVSCAHTVNYDEAIRKNSIDSFNSFQYIHPTSHLRFTQFRQHFIKAKRIKICSSPFILFSWLAQAISPTFSSLRTFVHLLKNILKSCLLPLSQLYLFFCFQISPNKCRLL